MTTAYRWDGPGSFALAESMAVRLRESGVCSQLTLHAGSVTLEVRGRDLWRLRSLQRSRPQDFGGC